VAVLSTAFAALTIRSTTICCGTRTKGKSNHCSCSNKNEKFFHTSHNNKDIRQILPILQSETPQQIDLEAKN
tara:strand:- start:1103 stop:1318 length:216 start_codon:yes stop_codon:yes gene_type:complete